MKALHGGSLAGIVAVVSGSFSLVVFAQDCWVCTESCTEGESGLCSEGMTVCEDGASAAGPGQEGVTSLQPFWHTKECRTYTGGEWFHSADCEPPLGGQPISCGTGTPGQCCFWVEGLDGDIEITEVQVQIQRCDDNSPTCESQD